MNFPQIKRHVGHRIEAEVLERNVASVRERDRVRTNILTRERLAQIRCATCDVVLERRRKTVDRKEVPATV